MSTAEHAEERFKRLIPRSQDCTVILLKGHLLVEEQLQTFVEALVVDPRSLRDARLTFHQWFCVGKALDLGTKGNYLWKFVEQLNQTRNKLAHNAEVSDFERKVDALIELYAEEGFARSCSARDRASRLRSTLAFVCGMLYGMSQAFAELKKRQ